MSDSLFADRASLLSKAALDGLSLRQQAISRNLANIDTPGYQAQTVNFDEAIKRFREMDTSLPLAQTQAGHHASLDAALTGFAIENRTGGSMRADQNNVDIDVEMMEMSEVGIQYQAISQAVSQKLLLLKLLARQ